jgi:hypothetical protein
MSRTFRRTKENFHRYYLKPAILQNVPNEELEEEFNGYFIFCHSDNPSGVFSAPKYYRQTHNKSFRMQSKEQLAAHLADENNDEVFPHKKKVNWYWL